MANHMASGRGLSRLFNDRKIATKIAIGFALVLAITAVISASAYLAFGRVDQGFASFAKQTGNAEKAAALDQGFLFLRWSAREYALAGDPTFLDQAKKGQEALAEAIQKVQAALVKPENKRKVEEISTELATYNKDFAKVAALKQEQIKITKEVLDPSGVRLLTDFEELQSLAAKAGNSNMLTLAGEGLKYVMLARLNVNKLLGRHEQSATDGDQCLDRHPTYGDLFNAHAGADRLRPGSA